MIERSARHATVSGPFGDGHSNGDEVGPPERAQSGAAPRVELFGRGRGLSPFDVCRNRISDEFDAFPPRPSTPRR